MRPFRAALIQMRGTADAEANLGLFEEGVREAVSRGAGLVCGPDNMYFSGSVRTLRECATPVPGPLTDHLSALAKKHSVYLSPGTIPESSATDKPYNTFLLFAPDGALIGKYRKRHLFKVNIPGTVTDDEGDYLLPGEWPSPVIETALGRIGAGICYDLRFPEQFLRLALDGAEIILVPSAVTKPTGEAHWHLLCRTRAVETGCFVLAPNRTGRCGSDIERYGHSLIIDPWGTVLAEAGEGEEIVTAELRPEALDAARKRLRSVAQRVSGDSVPDP